MSARDPARRLRRLLRLRLRLRLHSSPPPPPLGGVGGVAVTTAVAEETAVVGPVAFVATTATRIVAPRSAELRRNVVPVAPEMAAQAAPTELQRCQR